ncbi:MAG TPA: 30S ribosomal protein S4 [archaeon]|nr:30S ribosomal protein S4 [archaeon]
MGQPKKFKKKYERPKKPYDKERIDREHKILNDFGLRRKKEIWRAESIVRDYRRRARELQAKKNELAEKELITRLNRLGIQCKRLDDVLQIGLDDILSRRLQTLVFKKGIANSMRHSRQMIVHGHVLVNNKKMYWPSYIVEKEMEDKISLSNYLASKMVKEDVKK